MQGLWGTVTPVLSVLGNIASIVSCVVAVIGLRQVLRMIRRWHEERQAMDFYIGLRLEAGTEIGTVWGFRPGTKEFEMAEILVEQGRLFLWRTGDYGLYPEPNFDSGY